MRFIKKLFSYALLIVLMLQSCVVYHRKPIAIEDAYNKGMVKLVTVDGGKLKYDNLIQKDGETLGATGYLQDSTNFWREYIRDEEGKKVLHYTVVYSEIRSVHLKNNFVTTTLYVIPPLAAGVGILLLVLIGSGVAGMGY